MHKGGEGERGASGGDLACSRRCREVSVADTVCEVGGHDAGRQTEIRSCSTA